MIAFVLRRMRVGNLPKCNQAGIQVLIEVIYKIKKISVINHLQNKKDQCDKIKQTNCETCERW